VRTSSGFRCGVLRLILDRDPPSAAVVIDVKTVTADSLRNFALPCHCSIPLLLIAPAALCRSRS
jgi:hypothetical protein